MKRLLFVFTLSLFYLTACTNSGEHTHQDGEHTHEHDDHSHGDDHTHGDDHDHSDHSHSHDEDHDHPHEQEEFTIEADSLRQDSLRNQ